jgi:predicted RNase H-like nuclease
MSQHWIAGADGCPAGWIVARRRVGEGAVTVDILPRLARLFDGEAAPQVLAVDMPIGLPEVVGQGGRGPEKVVRPLLGGRQSSVFPVPSRAAVYAAEYREACAVAVTTSDPPKKVSKQCFHLFPKIREVDGLLREQPALTPRVFEVHPEVAFWRLNGERALAEPKKVKSRPWPAGLAERRGILVGAGLPKAIVEARPPAGAAIDDLLDALANLMVAERILRGEARPFPDPPGRDSFGLPVAIWA